MNWLILLINQPVDPLRAMSILKGVAKAQGHSQIVLQGDFKNTQLLNIFKKKFDYLGEIPILGTLEKTKSLCYFFVIDVTPKSLPKALPLKLKAPLKFCRL